MGHRQKIAILDGVETEVDEELVCILERLNKDGTSTWGSCQCDLAGKVNISFYLGPFARIIETIRDKHKAKYGHGVYNEKSLWCAIAMLNGDSYDTPSICEFNLHVYDGAGTSENDIRFISPQLLMEPKYLPKFCELWDDMFNSESQLPIENLNLTEVKKDIIEGRKENGQIES